MNSVQLLFSVKEVNVRLSSDRLIICKTVKSLKNFTFLYFVKKTTELIQLFF